jgi:REP-associated tyrosine transposase
VHFVMILPDRKHPPHLPSLEAATPTLLLTVCTKQRRKILATAPVHMLLREAWKTYDDFSVGRYVILPDHIHLFVGDSDVAPYSLDRWVGAWKAYVSRRWPKPEDKPIWQRSFWDRQMWSEQACNVKWLYVRNNPIRHGLVKRTDDWPFQGVMNDLG